MPSGHVIACLIPFLMAAHDARDIMKAQVHGLFGRFDKTNGKLINEPLPILTPEVSTALYDAIDSAIPKDADLASGATVEIRWTGNGEAELRIPPKAAKQVDPKQIEAAVVPHLAVLKDIRAAAKRQWPDLRDQDFNLVIQYQREANAGDGPFHDHLEKRAVANVQLHPTGGGTMFRLKQSDPDSAIVRSAPGALNIFSGKELHARPGADPRGGRLLLIVFVDEPAGSPKFRSLLDE